MTPSRRKAIAVAALALTSLGAAKALTPTVYMTDRLGKPDLEKLFPQSFGEWRIDHSMPMVLPSPETQKLLDSIYNQTLTRTYMNAAGQRVMLSVAYGGDQSDATRAHLPEVCYPAQGFRVTANFTSQLTLAERSVPVRLLMSHRGARQEPITYWLLVGDQVTVSRTDHKLAQFRLGFKGLIPDGMLMRVSSLDDDMDRGHKLQASFLADMAKAVPPQARDRIFGAVRPR